MRQVDDLEVSSATREDYIQWICSDKLLLTDREYKKYSKLINRLTDIEFIWVHPRDENRANDGLSLRRDFTYETGLFLDSSSGILPKCTFFEMLAALAYRCEHQLMRNLDHGDRTSKWFFEMLDNIGLLKYDNRSYNRSSDDEIFNAVHKLLHRDYRANGSNGGLFPIKKRGINQKTEEIWKQLMAYLNENYSNDDPDLALYN